MTPRATSAASLVEALRLIAIEPGATPKGAFGAPATREHLTARLAKCADRPR